MPHPSYLHQPHRTINPLVSNRLPPPPSFARSTCMEVWCCLLFSSSISQSQGGRWGGRFGTENDLRMGRRNPLHTAPALFVTKFGAGFSIWTEWESKRMIHWQAALFRGGGLWMHPPWRESLPLRHLPTAVCIMPSVSPRPLTTPDVSVYESTQPGMQGL